MKPIISTIIFIHLLYLSAYAQITIAISDFQNQTGKFYLDAWEEQIPEYLKSELSRSPDFTLLERKNLKAVLEEQALTMVGLIDSATAQQIGQLVGAQYIITGTITEVGSRIRIDAKIVNVASGKVISEKVDSPHQKYLPEMVELMGNNLRYQLTGNGKYHEKISFKKCPTVYFLAGTAAALTGTLIVNKAFRDKQDEYRNATDLEDFERLYDSANRLNKVRYLFATLTGIGALATIYCWAKNLSPEEVLASQSPMLPYFTYAGKGEFRLGVQFKL